MGQPDRDSALYAQMSFAQRSLWLAEQLDPGHPTFNVPAVVRITGELDDDALEWALNRVIERHETLRTVFALVDGEPTQVVRAELAVRLVSEPAEPDRLAELIQREVEVCFDLERGPLVRLRVFRTGSDTSVLVLVMHHLVSDGWSAAILFHELTELYQARRSGRPARLAELDIQYLDFAAWQHEQLQGPALERLRRYWAGQLAALPALQLPGDAGRPARRTPRGSTLRIRLPRELTDRIEALARQHQASAFMVLLAALDVQLSRLSGQFDIAVSSPVTGRHRPEVKGLIGYFVNTLILRTDLSGDPTFTELLGRVRGTCLDAYSHQDLPFDEVVGLVGAQRRSGAGQPLTRVDLTWQNLPFVSWEAGDLLVEPRDIDTGTTKDDLAFTFVPTADGYTGTVEYSQDLFDAETAGRLADQLITLLDGATADPDRPISRLPLLSPAERAWHLDGVNAGYREHSEPWVHELIARQAERRPAETAVLCGDQRLSYQELDQQANALALRLVEVGVGPETTVAVLLPRSARLVVALLAVLKTGGAYLPLDPEYPPASLSYILSDAEPAALITTAQLAGLGGPAGERAARLLLDGPLEASVTGPAVRVQPRGRCYLNYTSGSTGRPKGVVNVHEGMVNLCHAAIEAYQLTPADRFCQLASLSFDVLVEEVFPVLVAGGAVVLPDGPVPLAAAELWALLAEHQVSLIEVNTSRALTWSEADRAALPGCLRLIVVGGELTPESVLDGWSGWSGTLINSYGVTEASCSAAMHRTRPRRAGGLGQPATASSALPIGSPMTHCRLYALDSWLQPVPVGVPGELYIGGKAVARGYWNKPALTAERFLPDPYGPPGSRLYRTGDLVQRLPDGGLMFLGRADEQVKIRGFRVEPSEIEAVLADHPAVAGCAVVARADPSGTLRLVAFVLPARSAEPPDPAQLRDFLSGRLPRYLVPSVFTGIDRLPISPSGKLDRAALPEVEIGPQGTAEFVAPRTPLEELVADKWAELLGVPRIGVFDDFFEFGGHSLIVVRFASWVRAELGVELPLQALFTTEATVEVVAEVLFELLSADADADAAVDAIAGADLAAR